jgi:diacylglycerol O-acyltransferase
LQRLSGQDAYFLYKETPTAHEHTLKLAVCVPPAPRVAFDELAKNVEKHLHLLPPLRRRLVRVPFDFHHPVWIEDPDFDLGFHLRRVGAPHPGGSRELDEVVAEIASHPLDRSRPLWELWLVEGLAGGRVAYAFKLHHAVADGVAAAALIERSAARRPDAEPPPPERPWAPEPLPSPGRLLANACRDHLRQARRLPDLLARTLRGLRALRARRRRGPAAAPGLFDTPPTPWNLSLTARRSFATTSLSLEECQRVKEAFGVTLNDVALGLCAGALRRYLAARGALPERPLVASVPVAVPAPDEGPRLEGNRVAYFQTALHCELADPEARLSRTRESTQAAKEELALVGRDTLLAWMDFLPGLPYAWLRRVHARLRLADRYPSPSNLIVSSVRGPREPLYWSGTRMEELYSVGPLAEGIGLNVTIWSYCDRMSVALLACRKAVPDPHALADAIHEELAALLGAARREPASGPGLRPSA